MSDLILNSDAKFSECRNYRYSLWRQWGKSKPYLMIIGLNPSTADETEDDPTIRRCKRFALDWGFGGLVMTNLFAIRATDPKIMLAHKEPVGLENDEYLSSLAKDAGMILAAWGNHGSHKARDWDVRQLIEKTKQMKSLGKTKIGQPKHPLYIKADTQPEWF